MLFFENVQRLWREWRERRRALREGDVVDVNAALRAKGLK